MPSHQTRSPVRGSSAHSCSEATINNVGATGMIFRVSARWRLNGFNLNRGVKDNEKWQLESAIIFKMRRRQSQLKPLRLPGLRIAATLASISGSQLFEQLTPTRQCYLEDAISLTKPWQCCESENY